MLSWFTVSALSTISIDRSALEDSHPPRPRLALNVGITGHRANALGADLVGLVGARLETAFAELRQAADRLARLENELFDVSEPLLRLHTPLATGSDQLAAAAARKNGFQIRALLPFRADEYERDFSGEELAQFKALLGQADTVMSLPGDRAAQDAYVLVGRAIVAASDVLIAIWDGKPGNGPGGTAHVVELALRQGVPVLHLHIDREQGKVSQLQLLSGAYLQEPEATPIHGQDEFDSLVADILMPHEQVERDQIRQYYAEIENRRNWRIEYPLLLAMLRVKPLPSRPWRQDSIATDIERERSVIRETFPASMRMPLERGYGWANFLAIRYAQLFRSGHITNYALSAVAVLVALFGLLVPSIKIYLVMLELVLIGALFYNTRAGKAGDWHRRWLQYRHLAESLRPLVYLKRVGLSGPPFRSDYISGAHRKEAGTDWTRWYAAAIWREMDSPGGAMDEAEVRRLAHAAIEEQLAPQAQYHEKNAERMHELDHRLHEVGNLLMGCVIATCILYIIGYYAIPELVKSMTNLLVFLTAGLPAAGAAVFGMRGHGEHLLQANRSAESAAALKQNARKLDKVDNIEDLAEALQATSFIMLADLNEWTTAYSERSLEVPA